jgi:hypothetical protein
MAVYLITAIGGSLLGWARNGFSPWLLLPLPLVIAVIIVIVRNDRATIAALRAMPAGAKD